MRGPETYRGIVVPEGVRNCWDGPGDIEAEWWRRGVCSAQGAERRGAFDLVKGRTLWQEDIDSPKELDEEAGDGEYTGKDHPRRQVRAWSEANLVGSLKDEPFQYTALEGFAPVMHLPVLDIDVPCALLPSTTPGHFHLYIDREVTWTDYCNLVEALVRCGIVEEGYYQAMLRRGATFVRRPGIRKPLTAEKFSVSGNAEKCRMVVMSAPQEYP